MASCYICAHAVEAILTEQTDLQKALEGLAQHMDRTQSILKVVKIDRF